MAGALTEDQFYDARSKGEFPREMSYLEYNKQNGPDYKKPTLADVHAVFKKWLVLADEQRIDINLAVALSAKDYGTPLWLVNIFNSGAAKTTIASAIYGTPEMAEVSKHRYQIMKLTSRALVSGKGKVENDMAPKLDKKCIFIMDMAQILNLPYEEKLAIYSQMRDLYDGNAGLDAGSGKSVKYTGLHTALIGCATLAIDGQAALMHALGTRELYLRAGKGQDGLREDVKQKIWDNAGLEDEMRAELNRVCFDYQEGITAENFYKTKPPDNIKKTLFSLAEYVCIMRAAADFDQDGGLRDDVAQEEPTRVLAQLTRLFKMLKSLDPNYTDEHAIDGVRKVVDSSIDRIRSNVLGFFATSYTKARAEWNESTVQAKKAGRTPPTFFNPDYSSYEVSRALKLGRMTTIRQINALVNLGLLEQHSETLTTSWGEEREKSRYSLNPKNSIVKVASADQEGVLANG